MIKQIKDLWLIALRSDVYKQNTNGHLKNPDKNSYCCFGVLCELHRLYSGNGGSWIDEGFRSAYFGKERLPPREVQEWAGLYTMPFLAIGDNHLTLTQANDRGISFKQIADWIEERL